MEHIDLQWLQESTAAAITRSQTATLLNLDPRTVTRGIECGDIPSVRIGRRVLVPRLPLLAMLEGRAA